MLIQRARCWCITVNWQSAPTFSWFFFLRCHLLQNHRNKLEGECRNYFFSLFQFPQAFTLTKLFLCEPTAHCVTFLLARRHIPVLGILRMQMQLSFLFYVKRAPPPYIINLSVLFAHWSYFCMRICVEMKLAMPIPTNRFYQIIGTAEMLPLFTTLWETNQESKANPTEQKLNRCSLLVCTMTDLAQKGRRKQL